MTDISTLAPTTIRSFKLPRLSFPRLVIGALFDAMPLSLGRALSMAYVDPYTSLRGRQQVVPDDDLEGRDPNW